MLAARLFRLWVGVCVSLQSRVMHAIRINHMHRTMRPFSRTLISSCESEAPGFDSLHVLCHLNGRSIPAMLDTAAQMSVMSTDCVRNLKLTHCVDARFNGKAVGVGTRKITGEIRNLPVRIGSAVVFPRIAVLQNQPGDSLPDRSTPALPRFLIGMDVLRKYNAEISLTSETLKLHTKNGRVHVIPLLNRASIDHIFHRTPSDVRQGTKGEHVIEAHSLCDQQIAEGLISQNHHIHIAASDVLQSDSEGEEEFNFEAEALGEVSLEGF